MIEVDTLPNDVNTLKALLAKAQTELLSNQQTISQHEKALQVKQESIELKDHRIEILEGEIRAFLSKKFGSSSERWEGHTLLFNEAEETSDQAAKTEEATSKVKGYKRKKPGRKPLPKDLPRDQIIYELVGEDRSCECGAEMREMGEVKSETLKVVPAQLRVQEHIRKKYVCSCCEGKFKTASMPKQAIPKSIASPSLLAHVATMKYIDGLPLYRQEEILRRIGVDLPRATLANWMIKLEEVITPLINLIKERITESSVITMDETHVQVLKEKGRKAQSRSYMWVMVGLDPGKVAVTFEYSASRSSKVAAKLLEDFRGTLVSDGYAGYASVAQSLDLRHGGCWDHCRRYFEKAFKEVNKAEGLAAEGLRQIQQIYAIERQLKGKTAKERYIGRNLYSRSIIRHLRRWLDRYVNTVPPRTGTGKALNYMFNEWDRLVTFLEDGNIPISNEKAENAIRPFVVGRKNWLFSNSIKGAQASASIYSLVETAKANNIEPHAYLNKIFAELPNMSTLDEIETLLPWNVKI